MNRLSRVLVSLFVAGALLVSCKGEQKVAKATLKTEVDSLAYVIGMNIADNLIAMDSTINIAVVCKAIKEQAEQKAVMSSENAKNYYLRYLTFVEPERKRGYEEQYLEDLAKADRNFTRAKSGLTYSIEVIGDEEFTPKRAMDLISLRYTISRIGGEQIYSSYNNGDTTVLGLSKLPAGLQESVKMVGRGGKVHSWIPSKLLYGENGDQELGVKPFETLYYEIELIDMKMNGARGLK